MKTLAAFVLALAGTGSFESQAVYALEQPVGRQGPRTFANATVVSTDLHNLTLTIKRDQGRDEVLAVEGAALTRLKELKAGDEVILTVQEARRGEREVVIQIEPSVRSTPTPTAKAKDRAPAPPVKLVSPRPARPASPPPPPASPPPLATRPPTDTVGPARDPRVGAQQDPRRNPLRDPRVVPGLTEPAPSPSPTPSPAPTPKA